MFVFEEVLSGACFVLTAIVPSSMEFVNNNKHYGKISISFPLLIQVHVHYLFVCDA